jgi:hypothetical protein
MSLEELARTEIQWNLFGKDGHEWGISHLTFRMYYKNRFKYYLL